MSKKEFGKELEDRTKRFALIIIIMVGKLPDTVEVKVIKYQIVKSGTSIGANYREANRAVSRADFMNKISICEKESSETQYWLEIIEESGWLPQEIIGPIYQECSELLAIFTSIGKKK